VNFSRDRARSSIFTGFREQIQAAEGGEDVLLDLIPLSSGLHDLEVGEGLHLLYADEHGREPLSPLRE